MLNGEETYWKYINDSISLKIPKKLLLNLVRQRREELKRYFQR
jgi:signal-transduction protein with cAMP-binding, CBS, and nucleotidyltransferase domain